MWVAAIVIGVFLFLVLLLAIPVDLVFYLEKEVDFKPRVGVGWLFGLVEKDISGKKAKPKEEKKKGERNIKPFLAMLRTRGFLQRLFRFVKDIIRVIKIHRLKLNLRVGLDDPADTGLLFAAVGPAMVYTRSFSSLDVWVEPDFNQENFRGYCKGDVRAFPIRFVPPLMFFVFSPATIRAVKAMIVARRK